jgi:hypothetical protein
MSVANRPQKHNKAPLTPAKLPQSPGAPFRPTGAVFENSISNYFRKNLKSCRFDLLVFSGAHPGGRDTFGDIQSTVYALSFQQSVLTVGLFLRPHGQALFLHLIRVKHVKNTGIWNRVTRRSEEVGVTRGNRPCRLTRRGHCLNPIETTRSQFRLIPQNDRRPRSIIEITLATSRPRFGLTEEPDFIEKRSIPVY